MMQPQQIQMMQQMQMQNINRQPQNTQQNMNQKATHVIFYSEQHSKSRELIMFLRKNNLTQLFKLICVDELIKNDTLPDVIKEVPTLVILTQSKIIMGDKIYEWLHDLLQWRMQNQLKFQNQVILMNMKKKMMENLNGPLPFINNEMSGFSDNFGFIDDRIDFSSGEQRTQLKEFFTYKDEKNNTIFTPGSGIKQHEKKMDNLIIENLEKQLESQRNRENEDIKKVQKNAQIDKLIEIERTKMFGDK